MDRNHAEIVAELRARFWHVFDCSGVGNGFFDLILVRRGVVLFAEVKDGSKPACRQRLRLSQIAVHREFRVAGANTVVLSSVADVERLEAQAA